MSEGAGAKKGISGGVLLTIFLLSGAVIIAFAVRTFEAQLASANEAREAEYAAEYAAFDEAFPVEDAGEEAAGEGEPGDAPPIMDEEALPVE